METAASLARRDDLSEHGCLTISMSLRIEHGVSGMNTSRSTLMVVIFRHGVGSNQLRTCQNRPFARGTVCANFVCLETRGLGR